MLYDNENKIIDSKIKKKIIKYSFLNFVYLFKKKKGVIKHNKIIFFSEVNIIIKLFITSFMKDFINKLISKFILLSVNSIKAKGCLLTKKEFAKGPNKKKIIKKINK